MNIKLLFLKSLYYIVALRKLKAVIATVTKALAYLILSPQANTYYLCDFSFAPRCVHLTSVDIGVQVSGPADEFRRIVMSKENREELGDCWFS